MDTAVGATIGMGVLVGDGVEVLVVVGGKEIRCNCREHHCLS